MMRTYRHRMLGVAGGLAACFGARLRERESALSRRSISQVAAVIVLVCLGAVSAYAKSHPPLASKTDDSKCVECHEAKAKGKSVHSAIAIGCSSCHEVRIT